MPVEIVHPLTNFDDVDAMYLSAMKAYLEPGADVSRRAPWRRRALDPNLAWIARDHGRVVGTLRTIEDTLSVPGPGGGPTETVDADLLSLVSVSATHRRQGLLTRMLGESLTEAHDRGKPVSILMAAEWPIYGRFGYAVAAFGAELDLDRRSAGARLRDGAPVGTLREIDTAEASELAPPTYDAEMGRRAGLIGRDENWWDRDLSRVGVDRTVVLGPKEAVARHVVHIDPDGTVDGYVRWSVDTDDVGGKGLGGALRVHDLFATTPVGYRELWRLLLGVDLVVSVRRGTQPVDDPLPHLLVDGRAARTKVTDSAGLWLRILDVPAALTARRYDVTDRLTIEVVDPAVGGWAAGRWTLETSPEGASCVPADGATADVTVPQSTLASAYLGGVRVSTLAAADGLDEHTAGAAARLDLMFATALAPWCATNF